MSENIAKHVIKQSIKIGDGETKKWEKDKDLASAKAALSAYRLAIKAFKIR